MAVVAEGRELILALEKNQLLARGYTETHYTEEGQLVTVTPNHTDHCYYHGHVRGFPGSWVALSTCAGIRGLIVLSANTSYYVEPRRSAQHSVQRTERLPREAGGACAHRAAADGRPPGALLHRLLRPQRAKRDTWRTLKYMELFIVADHSLFLNQQRDLGRTKQRILEIANYVDKFYRSLNIKVALIGLEVWTERDQCRVTSDANATLWAFLQWKKGLKARRQHDNAQLLTGRPFQGTTIGMAPLEGMCSAENSGGVSADHSELPLGAAATMAHEIGHNFGMSHDGDGCCVEATPDQGGCVMAAATGHPFPRVFSSCSRDQLLSFFQKGGGGCLFNAPNTKELVVGRKCGNGFLEDGEECDCGETQECTNPCCNAHNCTLKAGVACAHGDCCANCQLKAAGTPCRERAGGCDLPEFCTGTSPQCPPNVYLLDGSACARGDGYCGDGLCLTHRTQCEQLWGPGASPAPDACFQDVNTAGDPYGNCGRDGQGNYIPCERRDAKCGKIQCQSPARRPRGPNTVSMDTTIRHNGRQLTCRGAFMYPAARPGQRGDLPDPGLVAAGTKCGDGRVCRDGRCANASFLELEQCGRRCHGHGVCNSNSNCHCEAGWAPPFCDKPGPGGSVDSGPVQPAGQAVVVALLLVALLLLLPGAGLAFWCYRRPNSLLRTWLRGLHHHGGRNCRTRSLAPQGGRGHANAAFTLRNLPPPVRPASAPRKIPPKQAAPRRPLPGNPVLAKQPPTQPLLVMVAPGPSSRPSSRPLRPSLLPASFPSRK
ncbi:disintegrin and metalloproteinase domain-containing protein 33 isoform X2 [Tachyglossus aculeatus]|uniref:disintegrin and metalloproteinase domain-containing protein 33 isoform X2 n=1 Tax=Tachyglossus aculeatus TaxID=9261 RepID=UPI0018F3D975|nr:disintegrin and metalloproteinase domain-containing protein 33 isoform X2 [Tachyglossus aculeatus]